MSDLDSIASTRAADGWTTTPVDLPRRDSEFHMSNLEIERIFFEVRNDYLVGLDIDDLWHQPVVPQVRELTTRFDAEVTATELDCATRIVSRSRRAFVMEQVLFDRPTGTRLSTCRSVHVTVGATGAVEIPAALLSAIERRNGGPIPDGTATDG